MGAYRSWVGLALLFLCAAIGSHLVADLISQSSSFQQPIILLAQKQTAPIQKTAGKTAAQDVENRSHRHTCPFAKSVVDDNLQTKTPDASAQEIAVSDSNVLHRIVSEGNKIRARLRSYSICRNGSAKLPLQVTNLQEE